MRKVSFFVSFIICLMLITAPVFGDSIKRYEGQTVYAPAAHNCFWWAGDPYGPCLRKVDTRLIIRNVDLDYAIAITSISIYGPDGDNIYEYIDEGNPIEISPLSSKTFRFPRDFDLWDANIDARPNYIVKWEVTNKKVIPPIIESARAFVNFPGDEPWRYEGLAITPGTVLKIKNSKKFSERN